MSLNRHGSGLRAVLRAYASQVHPVFMLPPMAASLFGGILTRSISPLPAAVHGVAIFCAVYVAHVVDGYVDFHVRGEDDDHPLTPVGCRLGLAGATAAFTLSVAALVVMTDWWVLFLTVPCWLLGHFHAPQLDTNPVTATMGYPVGVGLSMLGGHYVQAGTLSAPVVLLAAVFVVVLSGVKVVDDEQDYRYDRGIDKRTVAVVVGRRRARHLACALMAGGTAAVAILAVTPLIPVSAGVAPVPFLAVALVARNADPELATMLLVRASYLFFAALVVAVWFRPLS